MPRGFVLVSWSSVKARWWWHKEFGSILAKIADHKECLEMVWIGRNWMRDCKFWVWNKGSGWENLMLMFIGWLNLERMFLSWSVVSLSCLYHCLHCTRIRELACSWVAGCVCPWSIQFHYDKRLQVVWSGHQMRISLVWLLFPLMCWLGASSRCSSLGGGNPSSALIDWNLCLPLVFRSDCPYCVVVLCGRFRNRLSPLPSSSCEAELDIH